MPSFTLASDPKLNPTPVDLDPSRETHYGSASEPVTMRMLGGYFRFDRANAPLLVKLLPPVVHVRREEPGATRLRQIVELIGEEANTDRPERVLILERLVEVLLVEARCVFDLRRQQARNKDCSPVSQILRSRVRFVKSTSM